MEFWNCLRRAVVDYCGRDCGEEKDIVYMGFGFALYGWWAIAKQRKDGSGKNQVLPIKVVMNSESRIEIPFRLQGLKTKRYS